MQGSLILVDYIILGVIALSVVIGLWRGFLREFISLASWMAAAVIAFVFVEDASLFLAPYVDIPSVRTILAFGGLFLITLFLGGLINIVVGQLVRHTGLSGTDRLIGVVFGALRGAVLIAVLVLLATLTPMPADPWWQESELIPRFQPLALWLRDLLPPDFAENFVFPGEQPAPLPAGPGGAPSGPAAGATASSGSAAAS